MVCPKCKHESNGKWCGFCGFELDVQGKNQGNANYSSNQMNVNSRNNNNNSNANNNSANYNGNNNDSPEGYKGFSVVEKENPVKEEHTIKEEHTGASHPEVHDDAGYDDSASLSSEEEFYASEYDELVRESDKESSSATKRNIIIVCCVIVIIISLAVIWYVLKGKKDTGKTSGTTTPGQSEEIVQDDTKKQVELGMKLLEIPDCESAESVFRNLFENDPGNEEFAIIYNMLLNYNDANDYYTKKNYSEARRSLDKVPDEYTNYDAVRTEIDYLDEELVKCETVYETFENLTELMNEESYEEASDMIKLITYTDKERLTDSDADTLEKYRDKIEEKIRDFEDEEDDEREDEKYHVLSKHEAEDLLNEYCSAFVNSVNTGDFDIVAKHIHKSSELYAQQKRVVENYAANGTTERFDGVTLNSMKRIGSAEWELQVTEKETIYYSGGTVESKSYEWTYTVEYIDSEYYFTKIR